jgi:hypothetical protein
MLPLQASVLHTIWTKQVWKL